jgi:hypothetical protein
MGSYRTLCRSSLGRSQITSYVSTYVGSASELYAAAAGRVITISGSALERKKQICITGMGNNAVCN